MTTVPIVEFERFKQWVVTEATGFRTEMNEVKAQISNASTMFTDTTNKMSEKYGQIEPAFKTTEEAFFAHTKAFGVIQQEVKTVSNYIKQLEGTAGGSFQKNAG